LTSQAKLWDLIASEVVAIADRLFLQVEERTLDEDLRSRLAAELAALRLSSLRPYVASLERDPVHAVNYYLAVDAVAGGTPTPLLLHFAPVSATVSRLFPNPIQTGRIRAGGREVLVNLVPFASGDYGAD
jgi:hypothetical protein